MLHIALLCFVDEANIKIAGYAVSRSKGTRNARTENLRLIIYVLAADAECVW